MLILTDNAVSVIRALLDLHGEQDRAGLRITSAVPADLDGAPTFAAEMVTTPEPRDQIVESDGARVFLDSEAAAVLRDNTLDAQVSENGQVHLQLSPPRG